MVAEALNFDRDKLFDRYFGLFGAEEGTEDFIEQMMATPAFRKRVEDLRELGAKEERILVFCAAMIAGARDACADRQPASIRSTGWKKRSAQSRYMRFKVQWLEFAVVRCARRMGFVPTLQDVGEQGRPETVPVIVADDKTYFAHILLADKFSFYFDRISRDDADYEQARVSWNERADQKDQMPTKKAFQRKLQRANSSNQRLSWKLDRSTGKARAMGQE